MSDCGEYWLEDGTFSGNKAKCDLLLVVRVRVGEGEGEGAWTPPWRRLWAAWGGGEGCTTLSMYNVHFCKINGLFLFLV